MVDGFPGEAGTRSLLVLTTPRGAESEISKATGERRSCLERAIDLGTADEYAEQSFLETDSELLIAIAAGHRRFRMPSNTA